MTPWRRNGRNAPPASASSRGRSASSWSAVASNAVVSRGGRPTGARTSRSATSVTTPRSCQPVEGAAEGGAVPNEIGHAGAPPGLAQAVDDLLLGPAARFGGDVREHRHPHLAEARGVDVLLHLHEAGLPQPENAGLRVASEPLGERREAQGAGPQLLQNRVLGVVAGLREADDRPAGPHPRGGQDEAVALARRRQVVLGHPRREVEQRRRDEGALVEHLHDLLERVAPVAVRGSGRDPDHAAPAEGHQHPHAALGHEKAGRHPVGEGRLEGHGQRDGDEAGVHGSHFTRSGRGGRSGRPGARRGLSPRGPGPDGPGGAGRPSCPPRRPSFPPGFAGGRRDGRSA